MEPGARGRNKKLIWALEADRIHGRPKCSECNEGLQRDRGCYKPGFAIPGKKAFRFTSLRLAPDDQVLRECPVGRVLREAPYVYQSWQAAGYAESSLHSQPRYLQQIAAIRGHETDRLREMEQAQSQGRRDAEHGANMLRRR